MTLTLELTPEQVTRLEADAQREGMAVEDYAVDRLMGVFRSRARKGSLSELLHQWRDEDANMTNEEKEQADRDWEELKANLDAERAANGERLLFP